MSKIVCLGILVVDIIAKPVVEIPEEGKLTLADTISFYTGGCATNTAIDLAKLGEDVGIIGAVGKDLSGEFLENELKKQNVNIDGIVKIQDINTSTSVVLTNQKGERSFIHSMGSNAHFSKEFIRMDLIDQCQILFIAGALLMPKFDGAEMAETLKIAKEKGIYTVLDTAWNSESNWMDSISPCLPFLDVFIPSYEEARMLSGLSDEKEMSNLFLELGAKNVVIKLGEKGCYIKNSMEDVYISGFKVNSVDTTGAGDSFVAGFIKGIVNGWDIKKSALFANAVGALCVMGVGASTNIKDTDETIQFIKENRNEF